MRRSCACGAHRAGSSPYALRAPHASGGLEAEAFPVRVLCVGAAGASACVQPKTCPVYTVVLE
jgi:hypothetical protein